MNPSQVVNSPGFDAVRVAVEREAAPAGRAAQRRVAHLAALMAAVGAVADDGINLAQASPDDVAGLVARRPGWTGDAAPADVALVTDALKIAAATATEWDCARQVGQAWGGLDVVRGGKLDEAVVVVRLAGAAFSQSHAGGGACCLARAIGVECKEPAAPEDASAAGDAEGCFTGACGLR